MVTKKKCIEIFNAMIRGTPVPYKEELLPLISEYLTENNIENSEKIISLIIQNPQLAQNTLPKIVEYYSKKFCILSIKQPNSKEFINNFKTILYYE